MGWTVLNIFDIFTGLHIFHSMFPTKFVIERKKMAVSRVLIKKKKHFDRRETESV